MDRMQTVQSIKVKRDSSQDNGSNSNTAAVCPTQGSSRELAKSNNLTSQISNEESNHETDLKAFTSVMLRAWRRRRADVQRLQVVVEQLKTSVSIE